MLRTPFSLGFGEKSKRTRSLPGFGETAIEADDCKRRLRANTDELIARGGFGSPTMFVDGSMFFGNDRLPFVELALKGELP